MTIVDKIQQNGGLIQFVRYCTVGVLNTLVCLGVIFICKSIFDMNPYVSNVAGYVAGVINSFLWNRKWVFHSDGNVGKEAAKFVIGFLLCYGLQFVVVWGLNQSAFGLIEIELYVFTLSGYGIATIIGNVVYTLANFVYNRLITFR